MLGTIEITGARMGSNLNILHVPKQRTYHPLLFDSQSRSLSRAGFELDIPACRVTISRIEQN